MPKVLISDSMSNVAQKIFEKNNISVDVKTGLSEDEIIPGETLELNVVIKNRGLGDSEADINFSINALNEFLSIETDSYTMSEMDARDSDDFSVHEPWLRQYCATCWCAWI